MEDLYNKIKDFLINDVNENLPQYEDGISLPLFTDKNVKFGAIDPFKYPSEKTLCAIYPERQIEEEGTISEIETASEFTLTIISRGEKYETLISQTCRYTNALLMSFAQNSSMNGEVNNIEVGERNFYPDCGIADKQATAVEIKLTIYVTNELEE